MGRCKSLGSVKLFLFVHPNTVEPVSPFFLHPEFPQSTALGAAAVADGCGEQHSLFTRMAGNSAQSTPESPRSNSLLLWLPLRSPWVEHPQDSCLYFLSPGLTLMKISASCCAGPRMLKQELRPFPSPREKVEHLPSLQSFKCSKIFLGQPIHTELESVVRRGWGRGKERGYLLLIMGITSDSVPQA